jgi:gliding motility-associated-like protein
MSRKSIKTKLFIGLLGLFSAFVNMQVLGAVNAPDLKCVSVSQNGSTTITWVSPNDPNNEFQFYNVYVSTNVNGPYTAFVVNGLSITQFIDGVYNANVGSVYYYVQTIYDDGSGQTPSASSDTARSILPIFTAVTDSTNTLQWNPVFSPNIVTNSGIYNIYRKIGVSGVEVLIGTRTYGNESYDDSFKVCSDSIYYRIENDDQSGCKSVSSVLKDLFEDNTPPATPIYDSITVEGSAQQVRLGWEPSSSPDTDGYIILYYQYPFPGSYIPWDTVWGRFSTTYLETISAIDPKLKYQQYTIAAFDSCYKPNANTSAGAIDQRTMHLKVIPNNCENTVSLIWNSYMGWADLDGYEILVSINNGPYLLAVTIPSTDTSYTHQKSNDLDLYCYKIRAKSINRTRTSTSNTKCALANSLVIPSQQYFKTITVENNKSIHIESLTDTTLPATEYVLFRSLEKINNFFEVSRIASQNTPIFSMKDYESSVDETSYYYRIGIIDTCGSLMFISKPGNSIFLEGDMDNDSLDITLQWNNYIGWDSVGSGVKQYDIYRLIDNRKDLVGTVDGQTTRFNYPMKDDIELGANFCFEIEAKEDIGNVFGMQDSALSNRICFTRNLNVFVPNAFRPGGENPIFKPVVSFGELASFQMIIYDRWGKEVYETGNINQGWDGVVNGRLSEMGAYVYWIQVSNFTGASYQKRGSFILLR